jgi:starch phosphorylase
MSNVPQDPVCGMPVTRIDPPSENYRDRVFWFCSEVCAGLFRADPERYAPHESDGLPDGSRSRRIAYFSMEVALYSGMPTYAGGLGVLAGDTLRSFADLRLPVVGVSLLYRGGYFRQEIDTAGRQHEAPVAWQPEQFCTRLPARVTVTIEGRPIVLEAWWVEIQGWSGGTVPLLLLDSSCAENDPRDRSITNRLYAGSPAERLRQEIVLGSGGIRMLEALGLDQIERYHMNEGHAALLALELLARQQKHTGSWDFNSVRERCIFTTHTPVPAGHDRFPLDLVRQLLGGALPPDDVLQMLGGQSELNMTLLGLNLSKFVNGVAERHGEVSSEMFPGYRIEVVTNGVHARTWVSESLRQVFDRWIPRWEQDPSWLRRARQIPDEQILEAHAQSKGLLISEIKRRSNVQLLPERFTVGFARRATRYKRPTLLFEDRAALEAVAARHGGLQVIFAGKAHPNDEDGKHAIERLLREAQRETDWLRIVFLADQDMDLARQLTAGVDLWLNTPTPPLEASGTSGMKAAVNGVPSLSVLDGWWIEGHVEGVTGWSLGAGGKPRGDAADAGEIYEKLDAAILPCYQQDKHAWAQIMKSCIALNGSYFHTHRVALHYAAQAYL